VDLLKGLRGSVERFQIGVNSPPIVVGDVVVVGSFVQDGWSRMQGVPGDVRGYDARTGKRVWTFHTVPDRGETGAASWLDESWKYGGSTNVWTIMTADEDLGYVYLPTSTPTNDHYGGHRPGDNLFAESVVCLNAKTGERVWHFQTIHHGVWDYDLPAAPVLADVTIDGKRRRVLAQPSKQAFLYVLDRETGLPIWPIDERPVPQSNVEGERLSATQPFPTRPAAFDRQGMTEDDLIDFTPALRQEAARLLKQYEFGPLYTPPMNPRIPRVERHGEILSETELPANAGGSPITYSVGSQQFIVVPIGGGGIPAELVALSPGRQ
jgi:glucose dehydrogenase